mmetsp:Transcript_5756/g.23966  ORF Transcript_5756/g.23966 Transcript_5756/m.23966 type:complete len:238 (-) Transcript_5756:503-1216(-)
MFARPESSLTSTRCALPTARGSTCSYARESFATAATWRPPLCAKADAPTYGRASSCARLRVSSTNRDSAVRSTTSHETRVRGPSSGWSGGLLLLVVVGAASTRSDLSARAPTTAQRSALPHRSPTPLTVPWTTVAPPRTAASEFATARPASLCAWIPTLTTPPPPPPPSRPRRPRSVPRRRVDAWVSDDVISHAPVDDGPPRRGGAGAVRPAPRRGRGGRGGPAPRVVELLLSCSRR